MTVPFTKGNDMEKKRLLHAPTMVFITVVLLALYAYGYVAQIGDNNRSISAYPSTSQLE